MNVLQQQIAYNWERIEAAIDWIRRYQRYFYLALIFAAMLVLYSMLILPPTVMIKLGNRELKKHQKVYALQQQKLAEGKDMQKTLEQLKVQLSVSVKRYFSKKEFTEFSLSLLPQMARNHNIKLNNINYSTPVPMTDTIDLIRLDMSYTGTFFDGLRFVQFLERYEKAMRISVLDIQAGSHANEEDDSIRFAISVETFELRE